MRTSLIRVGIALVIVFLLLDSARNFAAHQVPLAVVAVVAVPFVYLLLALGDAGFLLTGLAAGFRPEQWHIGPIVAIAQSRGWRLRYHWRWWLFSSTTTSFRLTPERLRWRHGALRASEPATQLAVGAIVIGSAFLLQEGPLLVLAAPSALALWDLVARESGSGGWSNGLWIERWLFQPPVAARRAAIGELSEASRRGIRPRDWDERWVMLAIDGPSWPDSKGYLTGLQFGYAAALDRGDIERAGALIDRVVASLHLVPENLRRAFRVEPAFYIARFRHNAALADAFLAHAGGPGVPIVAGDLERARTAADLAGGRLESALVACDAASVAIAGRQPAAGWDLLDRELLDALCEDVRRVFQPAEPFSDRDPARTPVLRLCPDGGAGETVSSSARTNVPQRRSGPSSWRGRRWPASRDARRPS